jgi:hypothetical protein
MRKLTEFLLVSLVLIHCHFRKSGTQNFVLFFTRFHFLPAQMLEQMQNKKTALMDEQKKE